MMSRQARRKLEVELAEIGRRDPRRYLLEATAWTALGLFPANGLLLFALAFTALGRGSGILIVAGTMVGVDIMMGLLVFVSAKFGRTRLKRADAPRLYEELDSIRRKLKAPRIHGVFLDDSFNASLTETRGTFIPVFGRFITVGLPLLDGLSRDQFRAILAHEVGHASRAQGWTASRAYELYVRLTGRLEELKAGSGWSPIRRILEWYLPRLRARTFVLLRMKEAQADLESREAVGAVAAAEGLALLAVRGLQFHRDAIADLRRRRSTSLGEAGLFETFAEIVRGEHPQDAEEFRGLLSQPQNDDDTHPPLAERLRNLGVDPETVVLRPPRAGEAASEFFLADPAATRARMDALWKPHTGATVWADDAAAIEGIRARIVALRARHISGTASCGDVLDLARCLKRLGARAEALAAYREAVSSGSGDSEAASELGIFLAESGDPAGLEWLVRGVAGPLPIAGRSVEALISWHETHGSAGEADAWRRRRDELIDEAEAASAEGSTLRAEDRCDYIRVDPFLIEAAKARLESNAAVRRVWIVGKAMGASKDWRLPMFVFEPQPMAQFFAPRAYPTAVMGLATLLESERLIMGLLLPEQYSPKALEAVEKIPGALIIDRSGVRGAAYWAYRMLRWSFISASLALIPLMHWERWQDSAALDRLWLLAFDAFIGLFIFFIVGERRRNWALKGIGGLTFLLTILIAYPIGPWGLMLVALVGLPALSFAAGWWRPAVYLET